MANLPRKFVWLAERDEKSAHLALEPGKIYPSSSVSDGILIGWMREGKIKFIADEPGEALPADVVLEVQNVTISMKDFIGHLEKGLGLKEGENG